MTIIRFAAASVDRIIAHTAELLNQLGLSPGDFVEATPVENGVLISAGDATLQEQLKVAWQVMDEDDEALRRLAQS
jgi:hypothetical protein